MSSGEPKPATFIFIDRRKSGRGKSINNRQKLLRRIRESIKGAKPEDIDAGGISKSGQISGNYTNPVKVARDALAEPTFRYAANAGERDLVLIGNDRFLKGDEFPISSGEGGSGGNGSGNGPGEGGEDDFIINISRSEFFDVFFEDCELPDLLETYERELPEFKSQRAGFQKVGNPAQLSVIRSYKNALPRRHVLGSEAKDEIEALTAKREALEAELNGVVSESRKLEIEEELNRIVGRLEELERKLSAIPFFEKLDLRYAKREKVLVKSAQAVIFFIADCSGSMDETKKRIARKFFSLQYAFIKRKYPQTDLVFIAHTDTAEELSEEEFFTTRKSGGTIVSPAFALAHQIIKERYDAAQTNIYLSYAGDGDNWDSDNPAVIDEIETSGLLAKLRHASYLQVGHSFSAGFTLGGIGLWQVMSSIANTNKKMSVLKIVDESDVFDAFRRIYAKKRTKA